MIDPQLGHPDTGAQRWNSGPGAQTGYEQLPLPPLEIQPPRETQARIARPRQHSVVQPLGGALPGGFAQQIGERYSVGPMGSQLRYNAPLHQNAPPHSQVLTQAGYAPASAAPVLEFSPAGMPYRLHHPSQWAQTGSGNLSNTSVQDALAHLQLRQYQLDRVENELRVLNNLLQEGEKRIYEEYERADRISAELEVIVGDMYKKRPRDIKQWRKRMTAECDARAQQVKKAMHRIDQKRRDYGLPLQNGISNRAQVPPICKDRFQNSSSEATRSRL